MFPHFFDLALDTQVLILSYLDIPTLGSDLPSNEQDCHETRPTLETSFEGSIAGFLWHQGLDRSPEILKIFAGCGVPPPKIGTI